MEENAGHNGLYARKYERHTAICYDAAVTAAYCNLVRAEKVKAVGTSSDRKRKKHGNRNVDFEASQRWFLCAGILEYFEIVMYMEATAYAAASIS